MIIYISHFINEFSILHSRDSLFNNITPYELEKYHVSKCNTIIRLFHFIILNIQYSSIQTLLNEKFYTLLFLCLFIPNEIGFNLNDFQMIKSLKDTTQKFIHILLQTFSKNELYFFNKILQNILEKEEINLKLFDLKKKGI